MIHHLQDLVPQDLALQVVELYQQADYDSIFQERKTYYQRQFNGIGGGFPDADEVYLSHFCRSKFLESSYEINHCFDSYIRPALEQIIGLPLTRVDLRCYKMTKGSHFRIHKDDYQSNYGFIWYLNRQWKWDWGGLLLTVNDDHTATVTIPEFNKLVFMDHRANTVPHCVTPVTEFAGQDRYTLVGFLE
jgi:Rps23 Pro-64 3,4-dihydroxylase Tpa1-like proline 4-hydroxylase